VAEFLEKIKGCAFYVLWLDFNQEKLVRNRKTSATNFFPSRFIQAIFRKLFLNFSTHFILLGLADFLEEKLDSLIVCVA